jgi:SHS2 domain-containing protein
LREDLPRSPDRRPAAHAAARRPRRYAPPVRLALPQPFEDLGHVADVGVRVRGATAEEALARLALALAALAAGGGDVAADREERLRLEGGPDLAGSAVALLRELLFRLAADGLLPAACEVHSVTADGVDATVALGRRDPARHGEGADLKAVTWHAARLERADGGWVGQAVFDI